MSVPTHERQVQFLLNIQRLLNEGAFVATYKFALLHSIADLCVTDGNDSGDPLKLTTKQLAEKFLELYWRQTAPLEAASGGQSRRLRQITGNKPAAIVRRIEEVRKSLGGVGLGRLRADSSRAALLKKIAETIRVMPLWKLQTVGEEKIDFLYPNTERGSTIELRPGVCYCFRAFYPLVTDMVQGAWIRYIRRHNRDVLGGQSDLKEFLFGSDRSSLARYREILTDVQRGTCFYSGRKLREDAQVDHFIPWSRYSLDLGHNFVLANPGPNNAKSDHIAAQKHFDNWVEQCERHKPELQQRFDQSGLPHDLLASYRVAEWAYSSVERTGGLVWREERTLEHLSGEWRGVLERVIGATVGHEHYFRE